MRDLKKDFISKKIDDNKLLEYGFTLSNSCYTYKKNIDNHFQVEVEISEEKEIAKVIDLTTNEEYLPVDILNSSGEYVGKIREEYEKILNDIIEKCTTTEIFKSKQAKEIIMYMKDKYKDNLEYLWEKFPNNAIWRNKENKKWYGAILTVSENKLGLKSDKIIEVIDLRYQKEEIKELIDNKKIFPGYHMNKNSWITIKLDESVDTKEIFKLIDNSYILSTQK